MRKIGIIGCGNMGSAISQKLSLEKSAYTICIFDKEKNKLLNLPGIKIAKDIRDLAAQADTIILAVKPQDFDHVLRELKNLANAKLIISIAAGITTKHIEKVLGPLRVIRAMPNLGVRIAESVTCLSRGTLATDEDLEFSQELFYYLGTDRVIDEGMMNAATAISGSGPAYIFYFIETNGLDPQNIPEHARHDMMKRLEKAAEELGFDIADAAFLAANTTNAALSLLRKTKIPALELRKQVTSKAGTTEAAIAVLIKGGSWEEAARAALKRADELSKGFLN